MSSQSRAIATIVLVVVILLGGFGSQAGALGIAPKNDSSLMQYFKACRVAIRKPGALERCDTLFDRAVAMGDGRMQVMALYARLDYFCLNEATPEVVAEATKRLQKCCRKHNWPEFIRYYYAVSSHRLVPYYMRHNQANAAVYETCCMLSQAKEDNYALGLANCYRKLAEIYFSQSDYRLAYENYGLAIDCMERDSLTDNPLSSQYAYRAECALHLNMPDSAAVMLRRGREVSFGGAFPTIVFNRVAMLYHLHVSNLDDALKVLVDTERLYASDEGLRFYSAELYVMRMKYYMATHQYQKARVAALQVRDDSNYIVSVRVRDEIDKSLGDIYYYLGNMGQAVDYYRTYITKRDSIHERESRLAANDLSGILEIVELQDQTKELQLSIQMRKLRDTYFILFFLIVVVLLALVITVRAIRIMNRLKSSEQCVVAQNAALRLQGEELLRAKDDAERASNMKSAFIHNMSHEVRTPLNSIVGFSQVLASQFRKDTSTIEYASIIESSSFNLLRLVDDVLDIAALDQVDLLPRTDFCEFNSCCRECADKILLVLNPGVVLVLELSSDNPAVYANLRRVTQVLMQLLHNAAKFTTSGQIGLNYTCLTKERLLSFTISDTGPGIPIAHHEAVFDRFVKLDDFSQGAGLGLSVCRIITEKMGGTLRVDSTYTDGCSFILEIPFDS